jgi:hypothetical protein
MVAKAVNPVATSPAKTILGLARRRFEWYNKAEESDGVAARRVRSADDVVRKTVSFAPGTKEGQ